jgi:hypothetical protein
MNAPASSNAQAYDAQGRPKGWLSPTNRRRWANFKANRRGYWSLWIFMILFIASLLAEFIANDRPILASYKGEILYPVLVDYPEEKFGGFLARTDYRDPFIQDEIEANGWILWPPIRYSYTTANSYIPHSAPTAPFWLLDEGRKLLGLSTQGRGPRLHAWQHELARHRRPGARCAARLIYGFSISVLFGLIADGLLGADRRRGGCGAGLFRRLDRPVDAAFHRDLVVDAGALHPADHRRRAAAGLLDPARDHAAVFLGRRLSASSGPNSCAPAISNMSTRPGRSAWATPRSCSATCCPTPWWRR